MCVETEHTRSRNAKSQFHDYGANDLSVHEREASCLKLQRKNLPSSVDLFSQIFDGVSQEK